MAIRGLFYGVLMLGVGAFITLGLASLLEQRAIAHNEAMAMRAPIASVETPNVADGADNSPSRFQF
ncbi:MAG TPA: hypothetical protein VMI56_11490 [Reyranella sp.]|nr:hypothetical protein [Reyranella sp.]